MKNGIKTAMQEFIENNFYINTEGEYEAKWTEDTLWTDQIKNALEKEKEQIMFSYHYGRTNGILNNKTSEQFYNQTYNE
jgi:hypothetical protein